MANIKGMAIRGALKYIKENKPAATAGIIASLPAESKVVFEKTIFASPWYPYRAFADILRATDKEFGRGDLTKCVEIGDFAARQDVAGVFKMMMTVLTPNILLERSPIFWSRYCDQGKFIYENYPDAHRYVVRLENFPEMDEAHCYLMKGWMTRFGMMSRAHNVELKHTTCVSHGGAFCQWEGTWRE